MIIKPVSFYKKYPSKKENLNKLRVWIEDITENEKNYLKTLTEDISGNDAKFEPYEHGERLSYEPGFFVRLFRKIFSKDQMLVDALLSPKNVYCTFNDDIDNSNPKRYKMCAICNLEHDKIIEYVKRILDRPYKFYDDGVRSDIIKLSQHARNGEKFNILPESEIINTGIANSIQL